MKPVAEGHRARPRRASGLDVRILRVRILAGIVLKTVTPGLFAQTYPRLKAAGPWRWSLLCRAVSFSPRYCHKATVCVGHAKDKRPQNQLWFVTSEYSRVCCISSRAWFYPVAHVVVQPLLAVGPH